MLDVITQTLWVTTDRFEATTPGENFINPRCFGEDFAVWLHTSLTERGLDVSDPVQEDFGWVMLATVADLKFTISIGIMDESIGEVPATWCVAVTYEKPLNSFFKWFRPAPTESVNELFKKIQSALEAEHDFKVSTEQNQP